MKRAMILGFTALTAIGCATVPPGYVGITVNSWGTQRGVSDFPLQTGVVTYNPVTTSVIEYPVFQQRVVWVRAATEGTKEDESIGCRSAEGTSVNFDVSVGYLLKRESVPALYVRFKRTPEELTGTYIRDQVRKELCSEAEKLRIMDLLGAQMGPMTARVTANLNTNNDPLGIHFDYVSPTGKPHVDPSVEQAINSVVTAVQMANAAEQKVRQVKAQADQAREEARGKADAARIDAQGKADGNRLLNESNLSAALVQFRMLERWNGELPQVTGGVTPFVSVTPKQ